jgi:hypothetical protein
VPNRVDNVEQVLIDAPLPGTYTIRVSATGSVTNQAFSLAASANLAAIQMVGPELFAVRPNDGELFLLDATNELTVAPRELNLLFKGGADLADIDASTTAIRITRAGANNRFDVASMRSDLGTGGAVVFDFEAVNLGEDQNGIELIIRERDFGGPMALVPQLTAPGQITVVLNRNPGNETTAGELVAALNSDPDSSAILRASISPVSTDADPENVRITDFILDPASYVSDFGTGSYQVRFSATQSGRTGADIRSTWRRRRWESEPHRSSR